MKNRMLNRMQTLLLIALSAASAFSQQFTETEDFSPAEAQQITSKTQTPGRSRLRAEQTESGAAFNQLYPSPQSADQAFAEALKRQPQEWTAAEREALRRSFPAQLTVMPEVSAALREKILPVLQLFKRTSYEVIVVAGEMPHVCNFRTIAIVVTTGALKTLSDDEIRLATAHELAHELTGSEITKALAAKDYPAIRRIELYSDGVALLAAKLLGIAPKKLIEGIEKMLAKTKEKDPSFNELGESHPLAANRRLFSAKVTARLSDK